MSNYAKFRRKLWEEDKTLGYIGTYGQNGKVTEIRLPRKKKTTEFKNGKCDAFKPIRIKRWDSGYSIKCMLGKGTIVVRPYNEDTLEYDLKSFCDNCKEAQP